MRPAASADRPEWASRASGREARAARSDRPVRARALAAAAAPAATPNASKRREPADDRRREVQSRGDDRERRSQHRDDRRDGSHLMR